MNAGEISRKGLSLVTSAPSLIVAELAWRWAFAAGAVGVILSYSTTLRDAISLSAADRGELLSGGLLQFIDAAARIASDAMPYLVQAAEGALPKIALVWLVCATIGRSSLIRKIVALTPAKPVDPNPRWWFSMCAVHGVRVILLLIVLSSYLGAGRVASAVLGEDIDHPRLFLALLSYFIVFSIGLVVYLLTNFIASLAPLYVATGRGALDALVDAVEVSRGKMGLFLSTASVSATLRTGAAMVITVPSLLLLPLSRYVSSSTLVALGGLLTLVYCAVSDFLLLARTASYGLIVLGDTSSGAPAEEGSDESPLYTAPPDLRS